MPKPTPVTEPATRPDPLYTSAIMAYLAAKDPAPTVTDLKTDSYFDEYRATVPPGDLPKVEQVIATIKASAEAQP